MKSIKVSIIIPCFNEERYIQSCLESIVSSSIDVKNTEVIFIDGGSEDGTVEIIQNLKSSYPFIVLLNNSQRVTPISMNIGIEASMGEYIFILSAHASYPKDYFSKLLKEIDGLEADCVGGVLFTDVKNKNLKSNSIKEILTNKFGVGNASFRTGSDEIKRVDTVAFGCYRKTAFEKYGLYDERLIRNQDIELNKRIVNGGGTIYIIPSVHCTYYARETFFALAKNNFANGKWNILTAFYTKSLHSLSIRHFIPLFFVLSLLIPLFLSSFNSEFLWIAFFSFISYLALVIISSLQSRDKNHSFFYLVASFFTLHFSYGLGSLLGIFSLIKIIFKNKKGNE